MQDSDRIIGLLKTRTEKAEKGEALPTHLLITRYHASRANRGEMLAVADVAEILSVPLVGIVPESADALRASNEGAPLALVDAAGAAARAYRDAARRLAGEDVPLTIPGASWHPFGKLFRRKTA